MPSHILTLSWTRESESITQRSTTTADGEKNIDVALTASVANKQVNLTLTVANLKSVYIQTDVEITLKTNSSGTPDQTLTIEPGTPLIWNETMASACPIEDNITAFYITNTEATAGTAKLRFLEDVTP